ncbi:MAG: hypothetical protein HOV81_02620 [Kofleriaceae bacterium]|nr:hypothetical protein [Kofleriaceae bacterium]
MTLRRAVHAVLLVAAGLASGCDLYFGGGADDTVCAGGGWGMPVPDSEYRDPATGQCSYFGGGGGYCDESCGPCPLYEADVAPLPDWGSCYGVCFGLDQNACLSTPGCYGAYAGATDNGPERFWQCWDTAPSGPVGGSCQNLDAYQCSRHDNCIGVFANTNYGNQFLRCEDEPGGMQQTCASTDCGAGYHCEEQCYPTDDPTSPNEMSWCSPVCVPDQTCATVDCGPGYTCADVCAVDSNGQVTCNATCVPNNPNDPGECTGNVICNALPPACPMGTVPGISGGCYSGYCIPTNECGPKDPGTCGPAICAMAPPACPTGTVPGVKNGCWSGYCIPQHECPLAACETLTTEPACAARGDCTPVYEGTDCTCYPDGCTCTILTYDRCESVVMAL